MPDDKNTLEDLEFVMPSRTEITVMPGDPQREPLGLTFNIREEVVAYSPGFLGHKRVRTRII